ncbi:MAG: ABC transporter permease [Victivallales bacterium]|jgi:peptide/nickel transport system permease protein|nr:ABC transporter permease [Victivallales bacterium]
MFSFIIRRTFYSVLILLGVMLLTFVLFNVAAGDPAAAVLGKNARAEEIDALRRELGADLPLFYGRYCKTEAFGAYKQGETLRPGVSLIEESSGASPGKKKYLRFRRQFPVGRYAYCLVKESHAAYVESDDSEVIVPAERVDEIRFFRIQESPWNSQFLRSLREIVSFKPQFPYISVLNFGKTITTREPISTILWRGVWPSLCLMIPIFLGELIIGLLLSLIAAAFKDTWLDRSLVIVSVAGISVSYLVVIIFAQWFLGYYYDLFPVWGFESFSYLCLPIIVGIFCGIGGNVRFYRTVFVNELNREYLRTATAKGLSPIKVYGKHLLRNAAIQIITRASAALPFLFTGSLLLESFFGIPGLGFAGVDALYNSDLQLIKALVIVSALLFIVMNLLADLAYAWADPRIRLK